MASQVVQEVALRDEVAVLGVLVELLVVGPDHGQQVLLDVGQGSVLRTTRWLDSPSTVTRLAYMLKP